MEPTLEYILVDFSTLITNLDLGPTIQVRKGTKVEPGTDTTPVITICQAQEPERVKYIAFGHLATVWPIEITLVAANPDDYVTNLDTYALYRQQIAALFGPPFSVPLLPTTPGVYELRIRPRAFLPREEMINKADVWTLNIDVSTAK